MENIKTDTYFMVLRKSLLVQKTDGGEWMDGKILKLEN